MTTIFASLSSSIKSLGRIPLGLGLLYGGGMLLVRQTDTLDVWLQALAWVLLTVCAFLVMRPALGALVGPVLMFDMVRTIRRGRYPLLRATYAALLLAVLFVVYANWFSNSLVDGLAGIMDEQRLPPNTMTQFAESFFHTFLIVQFLAVLILAPAFTGGAIAEEREKGTLEDLLTTQLLNREIVFGKLLSRVSNLVLLLLAGVPILSLLQLLGGVDPALLLAGFAITLLTTIGVASLGMLCSVHADRPRDAIFLTYVLIGGYQFLTGFFCGAFIIDRTTSSVPEFLLGLISAGNVFGAYRQITYLSASGTLVDELPYLLLQFATFHGFLCIVCLGWSMRYLRQRPTLNDKPHEYLPLRTTVVMVERRPPSHPKLDDRSPMLWKECFFERGLELHPVGQQILSMSAVIILSMSATVFACGVMATIDHNLSGFSNLWLRICVPGVAVVSMLGLALRGAGVFSGERERQTFDSLLTSDLTGGEIIGGKLRGCLWNMRNAATILGVMLGMGILTGGLFPFALILVVAALAAHAAFAVHLGMYCSLVCRSTMRATVATVSLLMVVTMGHWIVYLIATTLCHITDNRDLSDALWSFHVYGLTPPMTLSALLVSFSERSSTWVFQDLNAIGPALIGTGFYALLAEVLVLMVRTQFATITGRKG